MARNSRELAKRPAVDPHDEPSAEWGWHGSFPRGKIIAGVRRPSCCWSPSCSARTRATPRYLWLIGIALVIAFMIWRRWWPGATPGGADPG